MTEKEGRTYAKTERSAMEEKVLLGELRPCNVDIRRSRGAECDGALAPANVAEYIRSFPFYGDEIWIVVAK